MTDVYVVNMLYSYSQFKPVPYDRLVLFGQEVTGNKEEAIRIAKEEVEACYSSYQNNEVLLKLFDGELCAPREDDKLMQYSVCCKNGLYVAVINISRYEI